MNDSSRGTFLALLALQDGPKHGYEVSTWYALWAPKGTPPEIVTKMREEVQKTLKMPAIEAVWKKSGSPMPTLSGEDFGRFVTAEVERWGKVVKEAQVKLE